MKVKFTRSLRALGSFRKATDFQPRSYEFESGNGEHYQALNENGYYQSKRPAFKGKTFKEQKDLPDLVVPDLKDTVSKYLFSVKPFCRTPAEFGRQEVLCKELLEKTGPQLQARLVEYAKGKRTWLNDFWDNQRYLQVNEPVVPYFSYYFSHGTLPIFHKSIDKDPLLKATAIITTISEFIESIKNEELPPEVIKGTPFCMNGFQLMFNSSRIPGPPGGNCDSYVFHSIYENDFIVIGYRGNFYKVHTHDGESKPYGPHEIWQQLHAVVNELSVREVANGGIGALTALNRDEWRFAHAELVENPLSRDSSETIQKASYFLALDDGDIKPVTLEEKAKNSWYGDGNNRFFDKSLQFLVARNGALGFLGEGSKIDEIPTSTLNDFIVKNLAQLDCNKFLKKVAHATTRLEQPPEHLPFVITPKLQGFISSAHLQFHGNIHQHELRVWHYNRLGKNFAKENDISPDAFIQQII